MRVAVASGASLVTRLVEIWLKEYSAPGQRIERVLSINPYWGVQSQHSLTELNVAICQVVSNLLDDSP